MSYLRHFFHRHFKSSGGIYDLLPIALPMMISQSFDTAMMFIDRLFLSKLGEGYMAACMSGGMISFTTMTFFIGLLSYSGTLTAHAWGAKQYHECPKIVSQGIWLSLLFFPIILLISGLLVLNFDKLGHAPEQVVLERQYFLALLSFTLFPLLRSVLAGFFTGIGRTWVLLLANFIALLVNVIINYFLIFGHGPFPKLGILGAGIGTGISTVTLTLILWGFYLYTIKKDQVFAKLQLFYRFNRHLLLKLWRYGAPCGLELLLNMAAFTCVISLLHSYGTKVADAVTIVFNWDLIAFVPMIGMQIGVTTMVGQYMGAKQPELAEKVTYSGFKIGACYALFMQFLFISASATLINLFKPSGEIANFTEIYTLAVVLLRLAAIYIFFDGMILVFTGALRGAGDTTWVMNVNTTMHWLMVLCIYASIKIWNIPCLSPFAQKYAFWLPVGSWLFFVCMIMITSLIFLFRFRQGKWKQLDILSH